MIALFRRLERLDYLKAQMHVQAIIFANAHPLRQKSALRYRQLAIQYNALKFWWMAPAVVDLDETLNFGYV